MRIYFTSSAKEENVKNYLQKIIKCLESRNHKVFENIAFGPPIKPTQMTAEKLNEWYIWYISLINKKVTSFTLSRFT